MKAGCNGTIYTCIHNSQSGVVGLLDNSGILVVEYKYDAWDRPISAWAIWQQRRANAIRSAARS